LNVCGYPCTIIDPRQTSLTHYEKRLKVGMFWRNTIFQKYNLRSYEESLSTGPLRPNHYRIFFEEYLWDDNLKEDERQYCHNQNIRKSLAVNWTKKGLRTDNQYTYHDTSSNSQIQSDSTIVLHKI